MNEVLLSLLYVVLSVIISVGGAFAAKWIKANTESEYKNEIAEAVITATACVQQTFVDKAKESESFKTSEQAQARNMAIDMATELLSAGAKNYLYHNRSGSEVKDYLTVLIEEAVRIQKKG